ncbi:MAG: DUF2306 domain-containing protein [Pseudomonadota bacterium]
MSSKPQNQRQPLRPLLVGLVLAGCVALIASDFIHHALTRAVGGPELDDGTTNRLWHADAPLATFAIHLHMAFGAVITGLAIFQTVGPLRRRAPWVHRWSGRVVIVCAIVTALGGLVYMAVKGTVGGPDMTLAFTVYGLLMLWCAWQTAQRAMARDYDAHREWALRLIILAMASWIYRVHYGLWFVTMHGWEVNTEDFSGLFDRVNVWAFFVPYLCILELVLWRKRRMRSVLPMTS